MCFLAS